MSNTRLFRELDSRAAAYTTPLMHQFLAASSAYSCATPDNRIKLDVEALEVIQNKDNKLREEESAKIQKIIEKSKNKLRETQNKIDSMNSKLNMLRKKLQIERSTKSGMMEPLTERNSEMQQSRQSQQQKPSVSLVAPKGPESTGTNLANRSISPHPDVAKAVEVDQKMVKAGRETAHKLVTELEHNLSVARKSVCQQKSFIADLNGARSKEGL